jgi:adenine phosphoribosyltransferase
VLVVDDLLATGGTVSAVVKLVEELGGEVLEIAFLIELEFLHGRKKLAPRPVYSLIKY